MNKLKLLPGNFFAVCVPLGKLLYLLDSCPHNRYASSEICLTSCFGDTSTILDLPFLFW